MTPQQLHQAWTAAEQLLESTQHKNEQHQADVSGLLLQLTALYPRLLSGGHLSCEQVLMVRACGMLLCNFFSRLLNGYC